MNPAFGGAVHAARSASQSSTATNGPDQTAVLFFVGFIFVGIITLFLLQLLWEWVESKLPESWR